jgi:protein tyrosine phosphatase (PTP) superfamily phosphohydrolase (DUF442 family)
MRLPVIATRAAALVVAAFAVLSWPAGSQAMSFGDPALNYVESTPTIATSGMPTRRQLQKLAATRIAVINLVPSEAFGSLDDEQAIVQKAGARYVHVPVDFARPRPSDFERFSREMRSFAGKPVLVHCQLSMRASVFVFLYRAIKLGEDPERVYDDVLKIWQPNAVWSRFVREELEARGIRTPLAAD